MRTAAFVAMHTSIRCIDHLSELMQTKANLAGDISKIKLHRTKCTMLIKHIIGEALKTELVADVGNSKFSLLIDESTDVSVCKYMCICIR